MRVGLMLNTEYPAGDDPVRRFAEHREQVRLARDAVCIGRRKTVVAIRIVPAWGASAAEALRHG